MHRRRIPCRLPAHLLDLAGMLYALKLRTIVPPGLHSPGGSATGSESDGGG